TGSAKALRDATGAEVLIHTLDTRISGNGERQVHCPGIPYAVLPGAWRVAADQLLEDADDVDGLRVLHTPGHTPGGISLFAEELGVLFPGDLFTQRGRYISRSVPFPGTNLASYHASMERISRLPFSVACLGHGRTLTERARETLEGAAAWYAESPRWRRLLQSVPGPLRLGLSTGYRYR
ncbi:MAG: MBL fold metallo-hydrolase, partial [Dehalococcoidia bacterium]